MHTSKWWRALCCVFTIAYATGISGPAHGQSKRRATKPDQVQSSLDPTEVFREASQHLATITTNNDRLGSAVAVAKNGWGEGFFVTNAHVIDGATSVNVQYKGKTYEAYRIARFSRIDLAFFVVEGEREDFNTAPFRTQLPVVGERVYAVGSPKGLTMSLSDGLVSGLRTLRGVMSIQTTAPISPGSSGGGLFDRNAKLIGITTAKVVGGENLNLVIPTQYVYRLLTVWQATRKCPMLNVEFPTPSNDAFWERYKPAHNRFLEWLGVAQAAIPISKPLLDACKALHPYLDRKLSDEEEDEAADLWGRVHKESPPVLKVYRQSDWFTSDAREK